MTEKKKKPLTSKAKAASKAKKPASKAATKTTTKKPAKKPTQKNTKKPAKKSAKSTSKKMFEKAIKLLDDKEAEDIVAIDLNGQSALADYIIIASGGSSRQVAALSEYLRKDFKKAGVSKVRIEGLPQGDWVLLDAGDILVHLFRPEVREFYQLEERWEEE